MKGIILKNRTLAAIASLLSFALPLNAEIMHGVSIFGDLKYPANFDHFDYANPDAPQGGEL